VFYGLVSHSVALLADVGHNFGDVLGLGARSSRDALTHTNF
jgi:Co/Zn/Cd efflux system component